MSIEEQYADLIHDDASLLLRPRTGLQDITVEVDAGIAGHGHASRTVDTIPVSQTQPNVQPDEILATLDGDTQAYLKLLLQGGAAGLRRPRQGAVGRAAPAGAVRARRRQDQRRCWRSGGRTSARSIHNFRLVAEELGTQRHQLAEWVDSSNAALSAFANQEAAIRRDAAGVPVDAARDPARAAELEPLLARRPRPRCAG